MSRCECFPCLVFVRNQFSRQYIYSHYACSNHFELAAPASLRVPDLRAHRPVYTALACFALVDYDTVRVVRTGEKYGPSSPFLYTRSGLDVPGHSCRLCQDRVTLDSAETERCVVVNFPCHLTWYGDDGERAWSMSFLSSASIVPMSVSEDKINLYHAGFTQRVKKARWFSYLMTAEAALYRAVTLEKAVRAVHPSLTPPCPLPSRQAQPATSLPSAPCPLPSRQVQSATSQPSVPSPVKRHRTGAPPSFPGPASAAGRVPVAQGSG